MICYKVTHRYKRNGRWERKAIGIYRSEENARRAIEELKPKEGFCDTQDGFQSKRVFRVFKPRLLDRTFWGDGFFTYTYRKGKILKGYAKVLVLKWENPEQIQRKEGIR